MLAADRARRSRSCASGSTVRRRSISAAISSRSRAPTLETELARPRAAISSRAGTARRARSRAPPSTGARACRGPAPRALPHPAPARPCGPRAGRARVPGRSGSRSARARSARCSSGASRRRTRAIASRGEAVATRAAAVAVGSAATSAAAASAAPGRLASVSPFEGAVGAVGSGALPPVLGAEQQRARLRSGVQATAHAHRALASRLELERPALARLGEQRQLRVESLTEPGDRGAPARPPASVRSRSTR